ncbi:MAG: hypothetical protein IKQ23_14100 [Treponema sp.]|nr:hypothetical protein [Treponema sp.]MBR7080150.1 hypothetical protein [Treponema sp.]
MTIIDEYLIDGFIERMNNGGLGKEDEQHFITKVNELRQEIKEQAAVIKFLKKELQHKTSYRQVMKKQYRELKQKYDALLSKRNLVDTRFANFVKTMEEENEN